MLIIHLEFCFLEVSEWEVPTPTAVISKCIGTVFNAFCAEDANFNVESLTLIAYTLSGSLSVLPYPDLV